MALRNGGKWPSVTEVLNINGLVDFSTVPSSVLELARDRGQEVHAWTEAYDKGLPLPPMNADWAGYTDAYARFKAEKGFRPSMIEKPVHNDEHRYDGTVDRVGVLDGHMAVVDIKCVYTLSQVTALQTSGYALCLLSPGCRRFALQLKRDGKYNLEPYTDRQDRHDFLAAVRMAHYKIRAGLLDLLGKEMIQWHAM